MARANDNGFMKNLLATFRAEAEEHIQSVSSGLTELLEHPPAARRKELIERIYRDVHSLKGAARAVNLGAVESICRTMENTFASIKSEQTPFTEELAAAVREKLRDVRRSIGSAGAGQPEERPPDLTAEERDTPGESPEAEAGSLAPTVRPFAETVRIPVQRLESILRQAEELLRIELAANQRAAEIGALVDLHDAWRDNWGNISGRLAAEGRNKETGDSPRVERGIQDLENAIEETGEGLSDFHAGLKRLAERLKADRRSISTLLDHLLADTKEALMLPFSTLAQLLARMVEDFCRSEDKMIKFRVSGEDVKMDKRILDEIKDPLIHLVRNCVDHGIESPEERKKAGKPHQGTVTLALTQKEAGKVEILVEDDGRGVDFGKVKESAVKVGAITPAESRAMTDADALRLIFESGVTTSSIITDLSGRGLGMSIVAQKVEQLGGQVLVDSDPGKGTRIRLLLPMTLATFRGIPIQVGDRQFVLPTANVERTWRLDPADIRTLENREVIQFDGQPVSFVRLADALDAPAIEGADPASLGSYAVAGKQKLVPVIVIRSAGRHLALGVHDVMGEQEVLVKPLGPQLARVRNVSGAAVLGSGRLVPVLNAADLVRSSSTLTGPREGKSKSPEKGRAVKSVLVVEDSVTSRVLLKNILQSAGYQVATAVDGVDALTSLRTKRFDMVVSDIEMPRMTGFELTSRIRKDPKLGETPVVLVTARETREDRERGIEAGANAYIVKSSFDQTNLLSVVESLL